MTRRSVQYAAFGLVGLLFAANNCAIMPVLDFLRSAAGGFLLGIFAAELVLVAIWLSLVASPAFPRIPLALGAAVVWFHCWFAGIAFADTWANTPGIASVYVIGLFGLPLILVATQVPLWGMRLLFRWRIEPAGGYPVRAVGVLQFMAATVIVALALGSARLAVGFSDVAGGDGSLAAWTGLAIYSAIFMYFGLAISVPYCLAITRSRRPALWFVLLVPYTMVGMGPVLLVAWLVDGGVDSEAITVFVALAAGLSAATAGTLALARYFGYRLAIGEWTAPSDVETKPIPWRRLAIGTAIAGAVLLVAVPLVRSTRLYRQIVQSITVSKNPDWDVTMDEGLVTELTISCQGLDLESLARMVDVQSLRLYGAGRVDLSALGGMHRLQHLDLVSTLVGDLEPLREHMQLKTLALDDCQHVSDLAPLAGAVNLEWLTLTGTQIADLSCLSRLPRLATLDANGSQVRLLPRNVPIVELYLDGTPIQDLSALATMPSLAELALRDVGASDFSPLADARSLRSLVLDGSPIADLVPLTPLRRLSVLSINDTPVRDFEPLQNPSLVSLSAAGTAVENLEPLARQEFLERLVLSRTGVADLAPLAGATRLRELVLDHTRVADLAPLGGLRGLAELDLSHTPVADVSPLARLAHLKSLHLNGTKVTDLAPLSELTSLEVLAIEETAVTDLSPLDKLTGLKLLYVGGSAVPAEELARLRAKLPNCEIVTRGSLEGTLPGGCEP